MKLSTIINIVKHINKEKAFRVILLITIYLLSGAYNVQAALVITNGLTHEHAVNKGDTINGIIIVSNTSATAESFIVYQRDYYINHAGESDYPPSGSTKRSNAAWINYEPDNYTLEPAETATINYQIVVPDTTDYNGTHWSVILVEGTESPMDIKQGLVTVNSIIRYAIQIVCHFNDFGKKDINFINIALKEENEKKILEVDIINSGDFMLGPTVSIEVFDEEGNSKGIYSSIRKRVFPKTSRRFEIDLSELKTGSYQSLLLADCSDDEVFGTNLTLEIKDE